MPHQGKKKRTNASQIQRLVPPMVLQRKRRRISQKFQRRVERREEAATYEQMLTKLSKEKQSAKQVLRHSSNSHSETKHTVSRTSISSK